MSNVQQWLFQRLKEVERIDDLTRQETSEQVGGLYGTMVPLVASNSQIEPHIRRKTPLRNWLNPFSVSRIEVALRCGGAPLPLNLRLALERNWSAEHILTQFYI